MPKNDILDPHKSGPDRLLDITEGGRALFWLVLVLLSGAALVLAFLITSAG
jgi:hypothetical protein